MKKSRLHYEENIVTGRLSIGPFMGFRSNDAMFFIYDAGTRNIF